MSPILIVLLVVAALVILAFLLKPRDQGGAYGSYFEMLNAALRRQRIGTPRILIDLDRLDHNIQTILAHIPSPQHYRIVEKSLPSVDLLRYIVERTGSHKFMVLHRPFLKVILENFPPGIDILLGKPLTLDGLAEFFAEISPDLYPRACQEIQWLVDTRQRLEQYRIFAQENRLHLRISLEIDVGLHRGGVQNQVELADLLQLIQDHPDQLQFSGFMGYDGHVPHAPAILTSSRRACLAAYRRAMQSYADFIAAGKAGFPALFAGELTFNAGGSGSYSLYEAPCPVNDIGIGGGVLRPSGYPGQFLYDLQPAIYLAAPLLKHFRGTKLPFIEGLAGFLEWWNPNLQQSFAVYGGGWAASMVAPKGIQAEALTTDPANQNLVPNESLLIGSNKIPAKAGDFIFYYPINSDAMFQFEDILLLRDQKTAGVWPVFDRRY